MRHIRSIIYSCFNGLALPKLGCQHICLRVVLWKSHLLKVKSRQMLRIQDSEWITKNTVLNVTLAAISQGSYLGMHPLPLWLQISKESPIIFLFYFYHHLTLLVVSFYNVPQLLLWEARNKPIKTLQNWNCLRKRKKKKKRDI